MKKRNLLLTAFAGMALAIGTTSCSNSGEEVSTNPINPGEGEIAQFDKSFLGSLAKYNEDTNDYTQKDEIAGIKELTSQNKLNGFNISKEFNNFSSNLEMIAVENETEFAIYSTQLEKIVIGTFPKENVTDFSFETVYDMKVVKVIVSGKIMLFDRYGNALPILEGHELENIEETIISNKRYYTFTLYNTEANKRVKKYYTYDDKLAFKELDKLPDPNNDDYDGPKLNDTFMSNKYDLSKYGQDAYVNVGTRSFSIFEGNTHKKTISLASNEDGVLVGSNLIIQSQVNVANDDEDYNLIITDEYNKVRVKVTTRIINLLTLEEKEANLDYAIFSYGSMHVTDNDGKPSFLYVYATKLSKNPVDYVQIVIDQNGNEVYDSKNMWLEDLIKLGDSYFLPDQNILFDKDMNVIADLSAYYITVDKINNLLLCNDNDKWGVIGADGKVKVEFKYDSLAPLEYQGSYYDGAPLDVKDNCIIASIENSYDYIYYRVNLQTGEETFLDDGVSADYYYDDYYTFTIGNMKYFVSQAKDYLVFDQYEYSENKKEISDPNTNTKYLIVTLRDEAGNYQIHKLQLNNPTFSK